MSYKKSVLEEVGGFDENLSFLLDCDLYKRYYNQHGPPKILNNLNVVIGIHDEQVSNVMPQKEKDKEFNYLQQKKYV